MDRKHETKVNYSDLQKRSTLRRPSYIVDVDGTLALMGDRSPYTFEKVLEDKPNRPVVYALQFLSIHYTVVIVTGRPEVARTDTEMWLHKNYIIFNEVLMRKDKDFRPDAIVKEEIYLKHIKPFYTDILGVFDDRLSVIRMWESHGLFVFNCNNGKGEF